MSHSRITRCNYRVGSQRCSLPLAHVGMHQTVHEPQGSLDDLTAHVGPTNTIEADFAAFHAANPHVYAELVRLARVWVRERGVNHLGIATLYEVARWNITLSTAGEAFKLNNNHRALYARLIMDQEPDLAGLFKTRRLHGHDPFD